MSENPYLSGNFAPLVAELTATDLTVTGAIPKALDGRLLRIGPNPIAPDPESHHWFTGNGMVHGVRLRDGKAEWYRNRFVRDSGVVEAHGGPPVPGPTNPLAIGDSANTNVIGHAGRTLAIIEAGNLPVELDDELETVARFDFDGTLPAGFSAHPKLDPDTGELHAAVYSPFWEYVQYVVIDVRGRVRKTVNVPVPGKPMVHDCAITKNYFVLLDLPCTFSADALGDGGFPMRWDRAYGARVGLLPRDGTAEDVSWCEVEPCMVFHPMNAYDTPDGNVVLDVARHPAMFETDFRGPNEGRPTLDRWILNPKSGQASEHRLDDRSQEFPRHDERRVGKEYRYGYCTMIESGFSSQGLLKHDLQRGTVEVQDQGSSRQFLEPVFVPSSADSAEDDGYVMTYVYDRSTGLSDIVILHAQDFGGEPVATISLPQRVPFGFHGNWIPTKQIGHS